MGRFDHGVESYTIANLDLNIFFPEDQVKCKWCRFIQHNDSLDRDRCGLTNEILFSREIIGNQCPLVIINEIKQEDMKQ